MIRLLVVIVLAWMALYVMFAPLLAHDADHHAQLTPAERDWFGRQISPKTKATCCSLADGVYAEEDIRNGQYWTRFVAHERRVDWMPVPDDVVIRGPNKFGRPAVWYAFENGKAWIRCYSPGSLM